jgi:hypothetical protein
MKTEIKLHSKVTCPVTDSEGEISYVIGILMAINSRYATVDVNSEIIKVGKTKIELAEEEPEAEAEAKVAKGRDLSKYESTRAASGRKSLDNGDQVAQQLRGKDLEYTYKVAAKHLGESVTSLKSRYAHLNPGQQRMCLGNRLRKS